MGPRSADHAVEMVERYVLACTESRADDVAALFAEDAELRDPFDGQVHTGRGAIREFFRQGVGLIDRMSLAGPIRVTGDGATAAAPIFAEVTMGGASLEIDSIDVFFFDDAGLFAAMHAFYGPTNIRAKEA